MKKKIVILYTFFFTCTFAILLTLDLTYKKYVVNLSVGHKYKISATQSFSLKEKSYQNLINEVLIFNENKNFSDKNKNFRIENYAVYNNKSHYSYNDLKSYIEFDLILNDKIDPKILESELNKKNLDTLNEVVKLIESNRFLFDISILQKDFNNYKLKIINNIYEDLVNSDFFKKYPPPECNKDKVACLKMYTSFYNYILEKIELNSSNNFLKNILNINERENISSSEIFKEFYSNRYLFAKEDFLDESKKDYESFHKLNFFKKKYDKFVNSVFFTKYIKNPDNFCRTYKSDCFYKVSDYFNTMLYKYKIEQKNKYKVELVKDKIKKKNTIKELPKILGITIFLTYVLFILTNKFFKRKLK